MIVLNMIVRDAQETVLNALDSVKAAVDFYVIGFAGESSDDTRKTVMDWLEANAAARFVVTDFEFTDFAAARNEVLKLTYDTVGEGAWMLWMDADDVVKDSARLKDIAANAKPEDGSFQFPYVYQTDDLGNVMVVHDRERLVRLSLGWNWRRPVHETLWTPAQHRIVRSNDVTWVHDWKAGSDTRNERNKVLLFRYLETNPEDVRTKLYIAHSYFSNGEYREAASWFVDYYQQAENDLEKWQAGVFAGDCFFEERQYEMALGWYLQAMEVMPNLVDAILGIAACYSRMGQFDKACYWYAEADKDKQLPPPVLFILPNRYTYNRWAYEHYALAGVGDVEGALRVVDAALEHTKGTHQGFLYYHYLYGEMLDRDKSMQSLAHLVYHLQQRGDALAALEILKYAPRPLQELDEFEKLQEHAYRCVEHLFNPALDIYSGEQDKVAGAAASDVLEREPERMERVAAVVDILTKHKLASENDKYTVLDIGCGDGAIPCRLAELGFYVTGIDSSEKNIERAKELAKERGVEERTRFIVGDARSIDQDDIGMHDAAIVLEVIEHLLDPANVVAAASELADRVVITTPHQQVGVELANTPDGVHLHHVREFDFGQLMRMAAGLGLDVETLTTALNPSNVVPGYGSWVFEVVKATPKKMPVVFYVGNAAEKWTPEQVDKEGIGGSETAVVEMAKRFRNAGHPTFVYGPVDGVWDGVFYRHFRHFEPTGPAAGAGALLFVSSRVPEVFDQPINAAVRWLWCHDNTFKWGDSDRLTPERAKEINSILVLSEWQKRSFVEQYPFAADKLLVTANGINAERFEGLDFSERKPHRFVWSSSFDRGLKYVLEKLWPRIREKWDDAELYVYYGFDVADKIYGTGNLYYNQFRQRIVDGLQQDGVEYVGRLPQKDMPAEFAKASYWLYPTPFAETYCITALEVQACGVIPVTSNEGALPERMMMNWPVFDVGDDEAYMQRLEELEKGYQDREALIRHALENTWDKVYAQWRKAIDLSVKENLRLRRAEVEAQEKANGSGD